MADFSLVFGVAYLLMVLGLAGSVIPLLPGPILIWLGALVWAWGDGFQRVGWPTLLVLGVVTLVAWTSDLFLSTVVSRRAGASWKAIGGSILGGLVGGILLSGVPILGTVVGALLGAVAGMWGVEYSVRRDGKAALAAVRAYISGFAVAALVEMTLAFLMLGIFAWQAF
jgi:uncharacterized protein